MASSGGKRTRHKFPPAPGRLSQREAISVYTLQRETCACCLQVWIEPPHCRLFPALCPCTGWGCQLQQMVKEQESSSGQDCHGPEECAIAMAWGCRPQPPSATLKDSNRPAPELGPSHWFFFSCSNAAAMRGFVPGRMHGCTSLSDPGHESPSSCTSPPLGKG